ncbi:hypothetical protein ABIB85_007708 [Bradyrhizobium sp. JR1.5]|uniref:hypothetical protein n=1 Tax=unclassified Bradyrhizobium TaxID=2631580 RepID=UPI003396318E
MRASPDRTVVGERREETVAALNPTMKRELRAERTIDAGTERAVAQETSTRSGRGCRGSAIAGAALAPLPAAVLRTDTLAHLPVEHEQIIRLD